MGALVGKVSGATEIRDCGVSGSVSTSSSSALYVGGLVGYVYAKTTVDGCYGAASVTGGSYSSGKVGGLIGYTYSAADVSNCYVTGEVTSKGAAAGALGYFSTSSSNKVTLTNCYAACDVGGSASYRYPFAYIYSNYLTATNCLYESGRENNKDNTQSGITAASADELKAAARDARRRLPRGSLRADQRRVSHPPLAVCRPQRDLHRHHPRRARRLRPHMERGGAAGQRGRQLHLL